MNDFKQVNPIIQIDVRGLCVLPYEGHPKGCSNFNKRSNCPPIIPTFSKVVDISKPIYVIWNVFDFGSHIQKMKDKHPKWSQRQLECCLYWQGSARKKLKEKIEEFKKIYPDYQISICPEGMGINITETMKQLGVELEWPPKNKTYQVALAYILKKE